MSLGSALLLLSCILIISCAISGIMALFFPSTFAKAALFLGTSIDKLPTIPFVDSKVDVDQFVLRYTRVFGGIVLLAAVFWAFMVAVVVAV